MNLIRLYLKTSDKGHFVQKSIKTSDHVQNNMYKVYLNMLTRSSHKWYFKKRELL